jgi:hypothetical protein
MSGGERIPHWDRCAAWLEAALAHAGEFDLQMVFERVSRGDAVLWPGERAAVVTEVAEGELHAWLAAGDLAEIVAMTPGLEAWGRAAGCSAATLRGRPGWARVLGPHGYAPRGGGELRKVL